MHFCITLAPDQVAAFGPQTTCCQPHQQSYYLSHIYQLSPDQGKQWSSIFEPIDNQHQSSELKKINFLSNYIKDSKNEQLRGIVKYINNELIEKGVKVGDEVLYEPNSEYEFVVDDEKLYRMFTRNITVVL